MDYPYPQAGAIYDPDNNTCTFTVWAPLRNQVDLVIDGANNETISLIKDEFGYWTVRLNDVSPGLLYRYQLDNKKKLPDPASRWQPEGVHGASAVVDPTFDWNDHEWKGLDLAEMIIYELHVGTFTEEGTFDGVISKLPYLKELGINAIELMPVAQFPGERNWGYDGVYPFAVQQSYGGMEGLKRLVNEAHKHGVTVILDVVYNHVGPEGNYLPEFAPYFTDKYKTGWGKAVNFDDAWCDGVRNFFLQNALMWLNEFHIDGLRLDAVHAIWDSGAQHFIQLLQQKVNALESQVGRKKILIAEFDLNNPRYVTAPEQGGFGLAGQWIDEFHHALHALITGEKDGYYEDFGDLLHLEKSFRESYVYTGQYSQHRKKHFGASPVSLPFDRFVVFAQNHDQVGNRLLGDRLTAKLSTEQLKLVAATYLLSPHVPMLFMGEEYGETNPFQYFVSHTDAELVESVRNGRREEFSYFNWEGAVPDPQSEHTFRNCILSWSFEEDERATMLHRFYTHLINFRKTRKALRTFARDSIYVFPTSPQQQVLAFERRNERDHVLVILNFSSGTASFNPANTSLLRKIFDSAESVWKGPGAIALQEVIPGAAIGLQPFSVVVYES